MIWTVSTFSSHLFCYINATLTGGAFPFLRSFTPVVFPPFLQHRCFTASCNESEHHHCSGCVKWGNWEPQCGALACSCGRDGSSQQRSGGNGDLWMGEKLIFSFWSSVLNCIVNVNIHKLLHRMLLNENDGILLLRHKWCAQNCPLKDGCVYLSLF